MLHWSSSPRHTDNIYWRRREKERKVVGSVVTLQTFYSLCLVRLSHSSTWAGVLMLTFTFHSLNTGSREEKKKKRKHFRATHTWRFIFLHGPVESTQVSCISQSYFLLLLLSESSMNSLWHYFFSLFTHPFCVREERERKGKLLLSHYS